MSFISPSNNSTQLLWFSSKGVWILELYARLREKDVTLILRQ